MLDSAKTIEFAYQWGNKVYTEVKICLNFVDITSRIVLLFVLLHLDSRVQLIIILVIEIIFIFHALSLLVILVNIEGEIYLVVVTFLY